MTTDISNPRGVDRVADVLEHLGVEVVFGLPGVHNLPFWDTLTARGIRIIGVRHEQAAAYAADGYARSTGRLGVAIVTTGPGAANAVCATGEAFSVGSPILVIATDIATTTRQPGVYRGALHECKDQAGMFVPVSKVVLTAEASDTVGQETLGLCREALAAPAGPAYLGIPLDVLTGRAPTDIDFTAAAGVAQAGPTAEELDACAAVLAAATAPLLWVGGGAVDADCGDQVRRLAELLDAPVLTTYGAKGIVSYEHPNVLVAPPQVPRAEGLWDESDVVVGIGTDFDAMMTRSWAMAQPQHLVTLNVDQADAGKNYTVHTSLEGDAGVLLDRLLPLVAVHREAMHRVGAVHRSGANVVRAIDAEIWDESSRECPEAITLLDALRDAVPDDTNLVVDMCVAGYWLGGFARFTAPRKLAYPVGWGTLGFSVPASIGVAAAQTGPTVVLCGDGGFLYAPGELATIVQEGLPVTFVVVDDDGYGMLKFAQDHEGTQNLGVDLFTPNFRRLAAAFDIPTIEVDDLGPSLADALAVSVGPARPALIWAKARLLPPPNTSTRSSRPKVATA